MTATAAEPIRPHERLVIVDVLRGFALLGILLVNFRLMGASVFAEFLLKIDEWPGTLDQVATFLVALLAEGKFISLFSLLFGLGFCIQMERATAREALFGWLFLRRMLVLLTIGLGHAYLLWFGDILVSYAVTGVFLLLFRKRSSPAVVVWVVVLLLLPVLVIGAMLLAAGAADPAEQAGEKAGMKKELEQVTAAYSEGTFGEIMDARATEVNVTYIWMVFFLPYVLGMFLIGLLVGRHRVLHEPGAHAGLFRRLIRFGLLVGLPLTVLQVLAGHWQDPDDMGDPFLIVEMACTTVAAPLVCLLYLSTVVVLFQRESWRRLLTPLAPVGRMALTNYLLQSVICTTMFYSYGLGLYGKVSPTVGVGLTLAVFAGQILLSNWWLKRFQFGPMEWVWRGLTYMKVPPFRRASP